MLVPEFHMRNVLNCTRTFRGNAHSKCTARALVEGWQLYQIVFGYRFDGFAGFAPRRQAADDHECVEAFFPQQMRHTGAGGLARSSTVEINVLVFGEILDFIFQIIRFDTS